MVQVMISKHQSMALSRTGTKTWADFMLNQIYEALWHRNAAMAFYLSMHGVNDGYMVFSAEYVCSINVWIVQN